jgi:hypothetical protein
MKTQIEFALLLVACTGLFGCSSKSGPVRLKTTPVKGVVHVDGKPAELLRVEFHPESKIEGLDHVPATVTNAEGHFAVSTYASGDGLPEGTYYLVFKWERMGARANEKKRPDRLNGAYADTYTDPTKSEFKATITKGEAKDLGTYELSTQPKGK